MIALLLLLFSCAGVLDLSRATPLEPGQARFQVGVENGVNTVYPAPGGRVAASVHTGVLPGLELGGGVGAAVSTWYFFAPDAMIDAKLRLGRPSRSQFHAALNPRLRGEFASGTTPYLNAELPLLLGWDVGAGQVVLAPKIGVYVAVSELMPAYPTAGLSLGWVIPLGAALEIAPAAGFGWLQQGEAVQGNPAEAAYPTTSWTVSAGVSFIVAIE